MAASPPVNPTTSRFVSRYGIRPSRRDGSPHFHAGMDIASARPSNQDEPIFAAKGGTVILVGTNTPDSHMTGYGNCVVIRHGDNTFALYAHLKDGSVLVRQGQTVTGGQRIATMGNTTNGAFSPLAGQSLAEWTAQARARGYRSGPMVRHLHFEIRRANPDGSSPFPGPYPTSPSQAGTTTNPADWLRNLGVLYSSRGAATIVPGSDADTSHSWDRALALAADVFGGGSAKSGSAAPASASAPISTGYEPVEFERDVKFGFTPVDWALVAGSVAFVAGLLAFVRRRRMMMAPNRRKMRLRANVEAAAA